MKVFRLPGQISALIFDLDNTLYTNAAYTDFQARILEERLAGFLGTDLAGARAELARLKAERAAVGLPPTSMANLSAAFGVDIATSARWREEGIRPAEWLRPDPELALALSSLAARFPLALVTNNPCSVGTASLDALGIRDCFTVVVGLDDTLKSKPDPAPFMLAAARLGTQYADLVSVGDRYDVDLAPALALGMGAILIEKVSEVYSLPETLM